MAGRQGDPDVRLGSADADDDALIQAARAGADRVVSEGVKAAEAAGFEAAPLVVEALGPVWQAIAAVAEQRDAAAIVLGSRGVSAIKAALLRSVSSGVVHHATRPVVVIQRPEL